MPTGNEMKKKRKKPGPEPATKLAFLFIKKARLTSETVRHLLPWVDTSRRQPIKELFYEDVMNFVRKRRATAERRKCMLGNGSILLEEMINSFNGKSNPIRSFSAPVILKATYNFDSNLDVGGDSLYRWYKGIIEDRPVLVKNYNDNAANIDTDFILRQVYRNIAVSSQMSSHKNVLKLLGVCIEFPFPVLVYENAEIGKLNNRGRLNTGGTLPWSLRLKIAKEVANAVTYLHTAFPKRFVHRDIKPRHIFLDKNWTTKLTDFSFSIAIPDGEPHVESTVVGTIGFLDPEYVNTSLAKESSDVYGLGVFLLLLLTGKDPMVRMEDHGRVHIRELVAAAMEKNLLIEIVDPRLVDGEALKFQLIQWKAFIDLALICTSSNGEDRPSMLEVAKELGRIEISIKPSSSVPN